MVVAVIFVTVFIEVITHKVDHIAEHTPYIFQIVQRVYKELMLLGIISFGLFLLESNICFPADILHDLHTVHILIFYMSLAYIVEAMFILYVAGLVARRWARIEQITLVQYAALKLQRAAMEQTLRERSSLQVLFSWSLLWKLYSIREKATYQDARLQFISCNRLPHNFAFNIYLKRCIRQVFVDLLHIHWGIWLFVCMIIQLDLFVQTSFVNPTRLSQARDEGSSGLPAAPGSFLEYCVGAGIIFILWLTAIYYKVLKVQDACFNSDLMEFNVWEELTWMMQQDKLERSKASHANQRKFLKKVKKQKTCSNLLAAVGGGKRTTGGGRRSIMGGFFGGGAAPDSAGCSSTNGTALCTDKGAASSLGAMVMSPDKAAETDEEAMLAQLEKQAAKKDDQIITNVQRRRCSVFAGKKADPSSPQQGGASPSFNERMSSSKRFSKDEAEHRGAVLAAWRFAATQVIHDIRLAKRLKKQKKFGLFSISHWGRTSRVFEKFFWFHSHLFIQYFLQGAVFCTAIYFALVGNFGELYLFTPENMDERLESVVLLIVVLILMFTVGLFTLVPSILMQYTMVMHLAQIHDTSVVMEAVEAATPQKLSSKELREIKERKAEQEQWGPWYSCSRDKLDHILNSQRCVQSFLLLLIIDFSITVFAAVVKYDRQVYSFEYEQTYGVDSKNCSLLQYDDLHANFCGVRDDMADSALVLERISLAIAYIFVTEVVLRFGLAPQSFATSPWDVFDALVVFAYAILAPMLESESNDDESGLGMILLLRILRILRFHRFMYAMTASDALVTSHESRREQLAAFCKSHFLCCFLSREPADEAFQMPADAVGEDPIAAMKAKRAAAKAEGEAAGRPPMEKASLANGSRSKTVPAGIGSALMGFAPAANRGQATNSLEA